MTKPLRLFRLVCLLVVVAIPAGALAAYDITLIADDTMDDLAGVPGSTDGLANASALNGLGELAFVAFVQLASPGSGPASIGLGVLGDETALSPLSTAAGPFYPGNGLPDLNDAGQAASVGSLQLSPGVFEEQLARLEGGLATSIAAAARFTDMAPFPGINATGQIAFVARQDTASAADRGVYRADGSELVLADYTVIADDAAFTAAIGEVPNAYYGPSPIDAAGNVAFIVDLPSIGFSIWWGDGTTLTLVAGFGTVVSDQVNSITSIGGNFDMDAGGRIALLANLGGVSAAMLRWEAGVLTTRFELAPQFVSVSGGIGLADDYLVFGGMETNPGFPGIYVQHPSGAIERVIRDGDPIDGTTLGQLVLGLGTINATGQVGFYGNLGDGRQAVFRADPVPAVPALGNGGVVALALALLAVGLVRVRTPRRPGATRLRRTVGASSRIAAS